MDPARDFPAVEFARRLVGFRDAELFAHARGLALPSDEVCAIWLQKPEVVHREWRLQPRETGPFDLCNQL